MVWLFQYLITEKFYEDIRYNDSKMVYKLARDAGLPIFTIKVKYEIGTIIEILFIQDFWNSLTYCKKLQKLKRFLVCIIANFPLKGMFNFHIIALKS